MYYSDWLTRNNSLLAGLTLRWERSFPWRLLPRGQPVVQAIGVGSAGAVLGAIGKLHQLRLKNGFPCSLAGYPGASSNTLLQL
jgi:hypothetical protein